jgi:hypothetical protein
MTERAECRYRDFLFNYLFMENLVFSHLKFPLIVLKIDCLINIFSYKLEPIKFHRLIVFKL